MDVQLQELIDKIKTEGVEPAKEKAGQLIEDAKRTADEVVATAKKEAARIVADANSEAEKALQAGRNAIAQAGRDTILGLKRRIEELFRKVLESEIADALSDEELERTIEQVFDAMTKNQLEGAELFLSESDAASLAERLRKKLVERVAGGLTISPSPRIPAGFRISVENGAAYYSFTPKEIAGVLSGFLNPKLAEILADAENGE